MNGGVLRLNSTGAIPGGILPTGGTSALTINGGVVELTVNSGAFFKRDLGTGAEQVQITGGASGFSCSAGSTRTVNFNDDAHLITWGDPAFDPSILVLQETTASSEPLNLLNPIDLGASARTVAVKASTAGLSGTLSGEGGSLIKLGSGALTLGNNVNTFDGGLFIKAGAVKLKGTGTSLGNGTVTLGDSIMGEDATLNFTSNGNDGNTFTNSFLISGGLGTRTISSLDMASDANFTISGAVSMSNDLTLLTPTGDGSLKFSGGLTGTGNLTLNANASGAPVLQTNPVNMIGTITNSGTGTNTTTISAVIGTNVIGVVQNSTNSVLKLSGVNTYRGTTTVNAGTLEIATDNCLNQASSVSIATDAKMYLNFTGTNTIKCLTLGGNEMPKGVYGASELGGTAFFTDGGSGKLNVTESGLLRGTVIIVY